MLKIHAQLQDAAADLQAIVEACEIDDLPDHRIKLALRVLADAKKKLSAMLDERELVEVG